MMMMIVGPWVVVFSGVGGSGLGIKETRISVTRAGCSVTGPTRIARAKSAVLAALALALHRVLVVLEGVADRHVPLTTLLLLLMMLLMMLLLLLRLLLILLLLRVRRERRRVLLKLTRSPQLTRLQVLLVLLMPLVLLTLPLLEHLEIPSLRTAAVSPTISMSRLYRRPPVVTLPRQRSRPTT